MMKKEKNQLRYSKRLTIKKCCGNLIFGIVKKEGAKIGETLQFCYTLVGNCDGFSIGKTWSREKKNRVRTALFFFLFLYMFVVYNYNHYLMDANYRYNALIGTVVVLIIAAISKEKELKTIEWNSVTARWWYAFWIIVCVSDFVVSKRFKFTGWIMLFAVGLLLLVWQHMEYEDDIVWNFLHAVEFLATAGMIYNMISRVKYDGLLYNGYMKSASDFGVFSAFLLLVFMVEIYECYRNRDFGKKMAFSECGVAVAVLQVFLSGKEIAIIFTAALIIILLFTSIKKFIELSGADKGRMLGYTILALGVVCTYYLAIKNIPWHLGTIVQYKEEQFESTKDPSVIAILAQTGAEVYQNVKYHTLDERVLIWKAYLREMNLFGHKKPNLLIGNKTWDAQNHVLQIMYRYGIFAVLPYIMLFLTATKRAIENCRKNWENLKSIDILCVGVLVFWCVVGFFGNLEYPYYQPVWLLAYLLIGKYLSDERKNSVSS